MSISIHIADTWKVIAFKLAVLLAAIALIGCKDAGEIADRLTHFSFDSDYVLKVPANPIVNVPVSIVTPDIETTSEESFSANKTRADMVEQVKLTALTLEVQTPNGGTLSFLKSVDIKAVAEGLPEVRIAYKDDVPANVGGFLSLDVTGAELAEYFKKTKYNLRITVVSDEEVKTDYAIKAVGQFFVDAKILGQ